MKKNILILLYIVSNICFAAENEYVDALMLVFKNSKKQEEALSKAANMLMFVTNDSKKSEIILNLDNLFQEYAIDGRSANRTKFSKQIKELLVILKQFTSVEFVNDFINEKIKIYNSSPNTFNPGTPNLGIKFIKYLREG